MTVAPEEPCSRVSRGRPGITLSPSWRAAIHSIPAAPHPSPDATRSLQSLSGSPSAEPPTSRPSCLLQRGIRLFLHSLPPRCLPPSAGDCGKRRQFGVFHRRRAPTTCSITTCLNFLYRGV